MAKRKKKEVDLDDMIEERVEALLQEKLDELETETREPAVVYSDGDSYFDPNHKVFCGGCIFWEADSHQENASRVIGQCHFTPNLPQRKAIDWCAKGIKHEE